MRIAFIVPSLANKGPVIVVKNLTDFLIEKKIYCEVFYFDEIKELNFKCKTTKIKIYDFNAIKNFDIVHSHGIRPDLYSFLNINTNIKKITTLHNYIRKDLEQSLRYSRIKSKIFETIWNIFLLRMDKIIVLSRDAKQYYNNILFNKNIDYIYNGLPTYDNHDIVEEQVLFDSLKKEGFSIMGTSALLTYRKGLHQIINILNRFPKLVFIVIGDGPEKENLESLAKKYKVNKRCYFLGYKQNAKKYLKYFDYFAIPSYSEGFPLALIEAASQKKAVVASDIPIHREAFNDKEVSFAKVDNEVSMINALNYLIKNKDLLARNIYKKYSSHYTLKAMGDKYLKIYTELIK